METLQAHSHNSTKLKNRILWFDGDSTISSVDIIKNLTNNYIFTDVITKDIKKYNNLVPLNQAITIKNTINELSYDWNIPETYKNLIVVEYIEQKFQEQSINLTNIEERRRRIQEELVQYKKLNLFDVLKTLIYIVETLVNNGCVWGVGRGSSVSSYILYVIGLHDIDSFLYELEISDFLKN